MSDVKNVDVMICGHIRPHVMNVEFEVFSCIYLHDGSDLELRLDLRTHNMNSCRPCMIRS